MSAATAFIPFLLDRFQIEWKRRDRSGVYGFTQRPESAAPSITYTR